MLLKKVAYIDAEEPGELLANYISKKFSISPVKATVGLGLGTLGSAFLVQAIKDHTKPKVPPATWGNIGSPGNTMSRNV